MTTIISTMTIAQALRQIKRTKGKIAELKTRATTSVSFDQAKPPHWDFKAVREELAAEKQRLLTLETGVAVANATKVIQVDGAEVPLAHAIRMLQELKDDMAFLASLQLREGTEERDAGYEWDERRGRDVRCTKTTVYVGKLSETDRAAQLEAMRDRFEKLNDTVEAANHTTVLRAMEL